MQAGDLRSPRLFGRRFLEVHGYIHRLYRQLSVCDLAWSRAVSPRPATDLDQIAEAILTEVGRTVSYPPVETDGAARAAALVAELL